MATEEQQVNSPVKLNLGDVGKALDIASGGSMCMVLNGKNYLRLIHEKWHKISSIPAVRSFGPCGFKMLTKPLGIPHTYNVHKY